MPALPDQSCQELAQLAATFDACDLRKALARTFPSSLMTFTDTHQETVDAAWARFQLVQVEELLLSET